MINHSPIFTEPELRGKQYWYATETIILSMNNKRKIFKRITRLFFFTKFIIVLHVENIIKNNMCK